jgi:ADP-ribose pyrophosphatase YjhB (NUDIX family)
MAISEYLRELRTLVGPRLLLLPGVAAVVRDGAGRVLFMRRADDGRWGLPAGAVDPGESPADAIVREVREETGLDVGVRRLVGVYSDPRWQVVRYPNGNVWHYVNVCFECVVRGGTLTTCDETLALRYVPVGRLPAALLSNHRIRIRDARARRAAAFVR